MTDEGYFVPIRSLKFHVQGLFRSRTFKAFRKATLLQTAEYYWGPLRMICLNTATTSVVMVFFSSSPPIAGWSTWRMTPSSLVMIPGICFDFEQMNIYFLTKGPFKDYVLGHFGP